MTLTRLTRLKPRCRKKTRRLKHIRPQAGVTEKKHFTEEVCGTSDDDLLNESDQPVNPVRSELVSLLKNTSDDTCTLIDTVAELPVVNDCTIADDTQLNNIPELISEPIANEEVVSAEVGGRTSVGISHDNRSATTVHTRPGQKVVISLAQGNTVRSQAVAKASNVPGSPVAVEMLDKMQAICNRHRIKASENRPVRNDIPTVSRNVPRPQDQRQRVVDGSTDRSDKEPARKRTQYSQRLVTRAPEVAHGFSDGSENPGDLDELFSRMSHRGV